ncbi:type II toxin-antitoxin system HicA family toxin [Verrucomicrobiota bacterium sgz303538]
MPAVRPKDLARVPIRIGFVLDRQKGSHAIYLRVSDRRRVVIPMHNRDLKPGMLQALLEDLGLTVDDLITML